MKLSKIFEKLTGSSKTPPPTREALKVALSAARDKAYTSNEHYLNEVYGGASDVEIHVAKQAAKKAQKEVASLEKKLARAPQSEVQTRKSSDHLDSRRAPDAPKAAKPALVPAPPMPDKTPPPAVVLAQSVVDAHAKAVLHYAKVGDATERSYAELQLAAANVHLKKAKDSAASGSEDESTPSAPARGRVKGSKGGLKTPDGSPSRKKKVSFSDA